MYTDLQYSFYTHFFNFFKFILIRFTILQIYQYLPIIISGDSNDNDMDDYGSNSDLASDLGSDPQSERSSTRPKRKSNRRRTDVDLTDETPELRPDQRRLNAEQSDQLSDVQSNASQLRSNLISEIGNCLWIINLIYLSVQTLIFTSFQLLQLICYSIQTN